MEESRLSFLFDLYFDNLATKDQEDEFLAIVNRIENTVELERLMQLKWATFTSNQLPFDQNARGIMLTSILSAEENNRRIVRKPSVFWQRIGIAATVAIIAGLAFFTYNKTVTTNQSKQLVSAERIIPGSNKAVLVLANGKRINLTDVNNGRIANLSGITVTKSEDGTLIYDVANTSTSGTAVEFNTIETPKGGQYKINLPDGTSVALNAASSLKFPTTFSKVSERRVELAGEGYFEVAKDKKKPFIVKTSTQQVEVLGTHFNVNAYADEQNVKTTLLEGIVKVNNSTILKPGQQSLFSEGRLIVREADTDAELAWKNGKFSFTGKDFKSIMRTISRWYNVDVVFNYEPVSLHISGGISRFENINDVLGLIQETGDVKFKVEGRRVTVIK